MAGEPALVILLDPGRATTRRGWLDSITWSPMGGRRPDRSRRSMVIRPSREMRWAIAIAIEAFFDKLDVVSRHE